MEVSSSEVLGVPPITMVKLRSVLCWSMVISPLCTPPFYVETRAYFCAGCPTSQKKYTRAKPVSLCYWRLSYSGDHVVLTRHLFWFTKMYTFNGQISDLPGETGEISNSDCCWLTICHFFRHLFAEVQSIHLGESRILPWPSLSLPPRSKPGWWHLPRSDVEWSKLLGLIPLFITRVITRLRFVGWTTK